MIDRYFKSPVFWDYFFSSLVVIVLYYLIHNKFLVITEKSLTISTSSDLANIAFTLAGFILTLLTVLITFKSGNNSSTEVKTEKEETVFQYFFQTPLYFLTVYHLKNCIKSLVAVSFIGYIIKLCYSQYRFEVIFYFNSFSLSIIVLTIIRCLIILSKIVAMQKNEVN